MSFEEFGIPDKTDEWEKRQDAYNNFAKPLGPIQPPEDASCYSNTGRQFIWTFTKKKFFFEEPVICLKDLAHGLAHTGRWTGQAKVFMSVAQHSVLVAEQVHPDFKLAALLHDGAEAYTGDISKPLKILLGKMFSDIEDRIQKAVEAKFNLAVSDLGRKAIKAADMCVALAEARDLLDQDMREAGHTALRSKIEPWGPESAEKVFTERLLELM